MLCVKWRWFHCLCARCLFYYPIIICTHNAKRIREDSQPQMERGYYKWMNVRWWYGAMWLLMFLLPFILIQFVWVGYKSMKYFFLATFQWWCWYLLLLSADVLGWCLSIFFFFFGSLPFFLLTTKSIFYAFMRSHNCVMCVCVCGGGCDALKGFPCL